MNPCASAMHKMLGRKESTATPPARDASPVGVELLGANVEQPNLSCLSLDNAPPVHTRSALRFNDGASMPRLSASSRRRRCDEFDSRGESPVTQNAKNRLQELFDAKGWPRPTFQQKQIGLQWTSTINVALPDGRTLYGTAAASRKTQADVAAAEAALASLAPDPEPEEDLWVDAQRGDALVKLAAYLAPHLRSTEAKSAWLQEHESDEFFSRTLERWADAGDAEAAEHLGQRGEKYRSTVAEAFIWRRFNKRVLAPGARPALLELMSLLEDAE